jgi:hypothetical protein
MITFVLSPQIPCVPQDDHRRDPDRGGEPRQLLSVRRQVIDGNGSTDQGLKHLRRLRP